MAYCIACRGFAEADRRRWQNDLPELLFGGWFPDRCFLLLTLIFPKSRLNLPLRFRGYSALEPVPAGHFHGRKKACSETPGMELEKVFFRRNTRRTR
jgi:hypothetical protein